MRYLIHDTTERVCPYCDEPLCEPSDDGLHADCREAFNAELGMVWGGECSDTEETEEENRRG